MSSPNNIKDHSKYSQELIFLSALGFSPEDSIIALDMYDGVASLAANRLHNDKLLSEKSNKPSNNKVATSKYPSKSYSRQPMHNMQQNSQAQQQMHNMHPNSYSQISAQNFPPNNYSQISVSNSYSQVATYIPSSNSYPQISTHKPLATSGKPSPDDCQQPSISTQFSNLCPPNFTLKPPLKHNIRMPTFVDKLSDTNSIVVPTSKGSIILTQHDINALEKNMLFGIVKSSMNNGHFGFIKIIYAPSEFLESSTINISSHFLFNHYHSPVKKNKQSLENLEVFLEEDDIVMFEPTERIRSDDNDTNGAKLFAVNVFPYIYNKLQPLSTRRKADNKKIVKSQKRNGKVNPDSIVSLFSSSSADEFGIFNLEILELKGKLLRGIIYKSLKSNLCHIILYHKSYLSLYIPKSCIGPYNIGDVIQFKTDIELLESGNCIPILPNNTVVLIERTISYLSFKEQQYEARQLESNGLLPVFQSYYGMKPFYKSGEQLQLEENNIVEFKSMGKKKLVLNPQTYQTSNFIKVVDKYINAYLNGNNDVLRFNIHQNNLSPVNKNNLDGMSLVTSCIGGLLLFGVTDSGIVCGVEIDKEQRDNVRRCVSILLSSCKPSIDDNMVHITFIPVVDVYPTSHIINTNGTSDNMCIELLKANGPHGNADKDQVILEPNRYIICFQVARGNKPIYTTSGQTAFDERGPREAAFVKLNALVKELTIEQITDRIKKDIAKDEEERKKQFEEDLQKRVSEQIRKIMEDHTAQKNNFSTAPTVSLPLSMHSQSSGSSSSSSFTDCTTFDTSTIYNTTLAKYKYIANRLRQYVIVANINESYISGRIVHNLLLPICFYIPKSLVGTIMINDILEVTITFIGQNNCNEISLNDWKCENIVKLKISPTNETLKNAENQIVHSLTNSNIKNYYPELFELSGMAFIFNHPFKSNSLFKPIYVKLDIFTEDMINYNNLHNNKFASLIKKHLNECLNNGKSLATSGKNSINNLNNGIFLGVGIIEGTLTAFGIPIAVCNLQYVRLLINNVLKDCNAENLCSIQFLPVFDGVPSGVPSYKINDLYKNDNELVSKWKFSNSKNIANRVIDDHRRWIICIQISNS